MRGVVPTGLLVALLSGCAADQPAPAAPQAEAPAARPGGVPAWVPAYTPQQTALLAPVERAIKAPAQRVFPALDRFGYANNRPLANTDDAVKFTRMVTKVLNDSARFYSLEELPSGAANGVAQYGPPPAEPDGFKIVKRNGEGLGELVPAPGAEEALAAVTQGTGLLKAGNAEGAIEAYRAVLPRAPAVPALRVALGIALTEAGRPPEAEAAYRAAISADPTYAPAHLGLAALAEKRGDRQAARRSLVEALAYNPASPLGLELLRKLGRAQPGGRPGAPSDGGWYDPPPAPKPAAGAGGGRVEPFPIFLDVDGAGAIHVATAKGDAAQIYGGCRAVMRYEPSLRAQIFQQPQETPYYLSVAEEVVCLEAALGAYLSGKGEKNDPDLDQLLRIAREDGLSGYVMFEILGQHRPERARGAPLDVHRDTVAYLERWVLTRREPIPEGIYTAKR
jgi:tetratricopeptide (TPR) repeat protein